jgi:hypothetical protein
MHARSHEPPPQQASAKPAHPTPTMTSDRKTLTQDTQPLATLPDSIPQLDDDSGTVETAAQAAQYGLQIGAKLPPGVTS